ncbi:MAG: PilZ domain-containing protein [Gemmataceae bacterium]
MSDPAPAPKKTKHRARRRVAKRSTKVRAYRNGLGLGPNIGLRVLDLSETGVRLVLKEELPVGREFELTFEGPAGTPVRLLGRVVWVVKAEDGTYCAGASFEKSIGWGELLSLSQP